MSKSEAKLAIVGSGDPQEPQVGENLDHNDTLSAKNRKKLDALLGGREMVVGSTKNKQELQIIRNGNGFQVFVKRAGGLPIRFDISITGEVSVSFYADALSVFGNDDEKLESVLDGSVLDQKASEEANERLLLQRQNMADSMAANQLRIAERLRAATGDLEETA